MDLAGHIRTLITLASEMKSNPASDKKALNKTIARLEEAELWAKQTWSGKVNGVPPNSQAVQGSATSQCTCPDGVVDSTCPVHGQSN